MKTFLRIGVTGLALLTLASCSGGLDEDRISSSEIELVDMSMNISAMVSERNSLVDLHLSLLPSKSCARNDEYSVLLSDGDNLNIVQNGVEEDVFYTAPEPGSLSKKFEAIDFITDYPVSWTATLSRDSSQKEYTSTATINASLVLNAPSNDRVFAQDESLELSWDVISYDNHNNDRIVIVEELLVRVPSLDEELVYRLPLDGYQITENYVEVPIADILATIGIADQVDEIEYALGVLGTDSQFPNVEMTNSVVVNIDAELASSCNEINSTLRVRFQWRELRI